MNAIFFASGFAGLIYESIWSHYLKLFLGHAAYAQTLVLAIFMGGMAIGAALAARRTAHIANPLRAYAAVEGAIGILAIAFHPVFTAATGGFYDWAAGQGLSGASFVALKWTLAVALILPQSILLGTTFPLFAAAVTRWSSVGTGRSIATLYFANSMGGAVGVLMSGFVMIPALGLPGTIAAAGAVNLAIAALTASLARGREGRRANMQSAPAARFGGTAWLLVAVSFLTGASSFVYEIGWIRMLSLVLGSATHSFELMLCAFIVGLALGGFWVRKRIDRVAHAGALLAYVQIAMGLAALATLPLYGATFDLIAWVVRDAPKTDGGYALLNLVRYGISSLIMFPAAFCAGMTLPLVTRILLADLGQGEKAIGIVYSANTVGAIAGVGFAIHVGLPVLGLEYLVASGALVDVLLGVALLLVFAGRRRLVQALAAALACGAGTAFAASAFDSQKMVSGPFRSGKVGTGATVVEIAHGRTATISVDRQGDTVSIRTNGKSDAAAWTGASSRYELDEVTMLLLGALPLAMHDQPGRVANIGFGSGITGDTILGDPRVQRLDTIEIEPKMVDLARHFRHLNRRIFEDPRSAIHFDDAKSFFAAQGRRYDLIVSEPSNPWVSGVAGLFSVEFYRHVSRHLEEGGLFTQWIQTYETHPDRVASILKALDQVFDDYLVVALNTGDILVVARPHGRVALPEDIFARIPRATQERLRRIDVAHSSDIVFRVIGNKALLRPWLDALPVPANSDFAPYLDAHADYDRFIGKGWTEVTALALSAYPANELLGGRAALQSREPLSLNYHFAADAPHWPARVVKERLLGQGHSPAEPPRRLLSEALQIIADCRTPPMGDQAYAASAIAIKVLPFLAPDDGDAILGALAEAPCLADPSQRMWRQLLHGVASRDPRAFGPAAEALLAAGQGATEVRARYLLGMAVLGRLSVDDRAGARAVWQRFAQPALAQKPASFPLAVLRDYAFSGE